MRLPLFFAIAPLAQVAYMQAFERTCAEVFQAFDITTPDREAHFLVQMLHESGGMTLTTENLNYSAARLMVVWPKRFPTLESARPYASNPRALANKVYGGRLGNMNAGDGFNYRGRGLMQITGRANYQRATDIIGEDFIKFPELTLHPDHALWVAGAAWGWLHGNAAADMNDIEEVRRRINGSLLGLDECKAWFERVKDVVAA